MKIPAFLACLASLFLLAGCRNDAAAPKGEPSAPPARGGPSIVIEGTSPDNPAVVPTARDGRWVGWHQRNIDKAVRGGIDVLFIGDSITDQWYGPGLGVWRQRLKPLKAEQFGISADRTEHLLYRLDDRELEGIEPRVVVLMTGTNNLKSGEIQMSPADTAAGVVAVVDLIRRRLPAAHVLVMGILPRQPQYDWIDAEIRRTNDLLSRLDRLERVEFMDIGGRFRNADGSLNEEMFAGDQLHLSRKGYGAWADAVVPRIEQLLNP